MNSNQNEANKQKEAEEDPIWTKDNIKLIFWLMLALNVLFLVMTSTFKIKAFFYVAIVFFIVLVGLFFHIRKLEMNETVSSNSTTPSKSSKSTVKKQSQVQDDKDIETTTVNKDTQLLELEKEQAIAQAVADVTAKIEAEYQVQEDVKRKALEETQRKEEAKRKAIEEAQRKAEQEFEAQWQEQEKNNYARN